MQRDVEGFTRGEEMDIVDFLLGCNLLSRVKQDAKIKRKCFNLNLMLLFVFVSVMFQLCDHDQDGCMTPLHILRML